MGRSEESTQETSETFKNEDTTEAVPPSTQRTSPPTSTPVPSTISTEDQLNTTSDYPLPNHPVAQQHFDEVREGVKTHFADSEGISKLSDDMGEYRTGYSESNPKLSDKDVIHHVQAYDSGKLVDGTMTGQVAPSEILPLMHESFGSFWDSLTNKDKTPETASQGGDALLAAANGFVALLNDPGNKSY